MTVAYVDCMAPGATRRAALAAGYCFECACERCTAEVGRSGSAVAPAQPRPTPPPLVDSFLTHAPDPAAALAVAAAPFRALLADADWLLKVRDDRWGDLLPYSTACAQVLQ